MSHCIGNHPQKCEALKTLYDGQLATLKTLSERSFSTTLQALTLNIAVVAGLIGGKVNLSHDGKYIGTALLLVFNTLVVSYLVSKSRAHHREKQKFIKIQDSLAAIAGTLNSNTEPSFWRSFWGGTGIFIAALALSCVFTVSAVWVPLLSQNGTTTDNTAVKQDVL